MHPYDPEAELKRQQDGELARLVREGVRPDGFKDRMVLAKDKLVGNVPMGVDASNKTMRKAIGGGYEFLALVKYGFFGAMAVLLGALFLWAGFASGFSYQSAGLGAILLAVGVWMLKLAGQAWRNVRTISKA